MMHNIQIGNVMQQPATLSTLYDLGQHVLEVTNEGGILIAEHAPGNTPLKEAVSLDQDETYHLFLALTTHFRESEENDWQNDEPLRGNDRCS